MPTPDKQKQPGGRLFCSKPFKFFEVFPEFPGQEIGDVYLCCAGWLPKTVGNIQHKSVEEIWNGEAAQEIRRSILDGSFRYCNADLCPHLKTETYPVQRVEDVTDEDLKAAIEGNLTALPYGPRAINASYDRSCNLSCPSCRTELIIETENKQKILDIQGKIQSEALKDAHFLYITGSGDPFGSPYFRRFLQTMKPEDMPSLNEIMLHTNAQAWTERMWGTIPEGIRRLVKQAEISIDAATSDTYAINRRGGDFDKLLKNLEFISTLRKKGDLRSVKISMVVQDNNFPEMPAFVDLGIRMGFDCVFFYQVVNWGTYTDEDFAARAVHSPEHPRHGQLLDLLSEEIFDNSIVHLGNLSDLRRSRPAKKSHNFFNWKNAAKRIIGNHMRLNAG